MKKFLIILTLVSLCLTPVLFAQEAVQKNPHGDGQVFKMYQCPKDGYMAHQPGNCPKCGTPLEETDMTIEEARAMLKAHGGM